MDASDYLLKIQYDEIETKCTNRVSRIKRKYDDLIHQEEIKINKFDEDFEKIKIPYEKKVEDLSSYYLNNIKNSDSIQEASDLINVYNEKKDKLDDKYISDIKNLLEEKDNLEKLIIKLSSDKELEIKKIKKEEIKLKKNRLNEINLLLKKNTKVIEIVSFNTSNEIYSNPNNRCHENLLGYYHGYLKDNNKIDYKYKYSDNKLYIIIYDIIHKYIIYNLRNSIEKIKLYLKNYDKIIINFDHEKHYGIYKYIDIYDREIFISFRTILKNIDLNILEFKINSDVIASIIDNSDYLGIEITNI